MIPKEKVEEIREKSDIVAIISEYLPIKKRGKNYLALCPFHSEKTASFTVSQDKQLFHCFGCGEGGNVFAFIMKMEKMDFPEAVGFLAEKIGIEVEKSKGNAALKTYKDHLYEITEMACKFFRANLESNRGESARAYVSTRKISPETEGKFRLGFAEDDFGALFKHLLSRGAKVEDIEAVGLILPRKEKTGYYDRFRGRLMFPICDVRGRVIGFSGRALKDEPPKYLNSPDSVIFSKGDNLFGLNLGKDEIKKRKYSILVEGNVDVLSAHEAGFQNTVAPLGTAFTLNQAKLLKRFADIVVLAFDSDAAGFAASERAYEVLNEAELMVRILDLGKYKDPDEFIKAEGPKAFEDKLKVSMPAMEFKVHRIISRYNIKEIEPRSRAAYEVAGLLAKEKDRIVQKEYLKLAAKLIGTDEELLTAEMRKRSFYKRSYGAPLKAITKRPPDKVAEAEKSLIYLALTSEEAYGLIKEGIELDELSDPNYREIFNKLETIPAIHLEEVLGSEDQKRIVRESLLSESPAADISLMVKDCINVVKGFNIKKQIDRVRQDINEQEKSGNFETVKKLNSEYKSLSEILRTVAR